MKKIKFTLTGMLSAAVLFISGCSDDKSNPANPQPSTTSVRVIHTSYDAPAVDILVDNSVAISNLAYGQSSGYAQISTGTRNIKVAPTGQTSPVVIEADLTLEESKDYTVYAVNNLSEIEPVVSEDSRAPLSSKAKIRFLHGSPDAPAVDVRLNSGAGPVVFGNIAFKTFTNYAEVESASYTFVVTPAGSETEVVIFDPITVQNGMTYTVIAHGTLNNSDAYPFAVRVFIDNNDGNAYADLSASTSSVMVVHASPDAPGVDLLIDNLVVNPEPLTFPNGTNYLPVPSGNRNVKVNAAGTPNSVINADLGLTANTSYSVFATDLLSEITPLVIVDDLSTPAAGNAHVRFIHLSPNAPAVDITLSDGSVIFGNKSFQDYTSFAPLGAGTYHLQVRLASTSDVVLDLPGITLLDGKIYTVFAKGLVGGLGDQALGAQIIVNN